MVRLPSYLSPSLCFPRTRSRPPATNPPGAGSTQTNTTELFFILFVISRCFSSYLHCARPATAGECCSSTEMERYQGEMSAAIPRRLAPSHSVVVGLMCFPFVWGLIISAMVATWDIWRDFNGLPFVPPYLRDPDKSRPP